MSEAVPLVAMDDVHLTLTGGGGAVKVLQGVSLRVERGETLSVVGPSGAGKTTLIMVMAGMERPTAGRVRVAGQDLGGLSEDALARFRRENLGVVFQGFHLVPTLTALENVALPLEFAGRPDAREAAAAGLASVGLGGRLGHYPAQLSGGEQQRVAIARAFVARPPLLLADEPTGNLDAHTGAQVIDLLFGLTQETGASLILITHDAELARRCQRVVSMADGRLDGTGAGA